MSRQTDLAWAAGFIDGDGCMSLTKSQCSDHRRNIRYCASLTACQAVQEPMLRLKKILGGSVGVRRQYAKVTFPCHVRKETPSYRLVNRQNGFHSSYYYLLGGHRKLSAVLEFLLPYLVVKRAQAEALLPFLRLFRHGGNNFLTDFELCIRHWYWQKLRSKKRTELHLSSQEV